MLSGISFTLKIPGELNVFFLLSKNCQRMKEKRFGVDSFSVVSTFRQAKFAYRSASLVNAGLFLRINHFLVTCTEFRTDLGQVLVFFLD